MKGLERKSTRIVLIGSAKSGKTALVKRFLDDTFSEDYSPTVQECFTCQYIYKDVSWSLDIIDMCAPFMFPVMRDLNLKNAQVVLLIYEMNSEASMREAVDASAVIKENHPDGIPVVVVGTKLDLLSGNQTLRHDATTELLQTFSNEPAKHILTSAKNNVGINSAFEFGLDHVTKTECRKFSLAYQSEGNLPKNKNGCCEIM